MKERGWTLEQVKDSIEGRKADFAAYVDPQKKDADVVIEVLPTWEPSDEIGLDNSDKPLRVRLIQKAGNKLSLSQKFKIIIFQCLQGVL